MRAITQYLQERGYTCVPDSYYSYIDLWQKWYKGKVPSVHSYSQYNGKKKIRRTRKSLGLGKTIPEDWANLLLNEKVNFSLKTKKQQIKIEEILRANEFYCKGNNLVELTFALGTGAFVEFMDGDDLHIDYIRAGMIYPLTWDNGRITECAFASERVSGKKKMVYLNIHRRKSGKYVIENHLFERNGSNLTEVDLPDGVLPEVKTGSSIPRYQVLTPNIANNIDPDCPLGISVYANALDQFETADIIFDSYSNEYRLGKKRITVPMTMARFQMEEDGTITPIFDDADTEFYAVPQDDKGENKIQEHNMELRSAAHSAGIQDILNLVSWKCGFGMKRYKFTNGDMKTATEVISDNSDLYRNMRKHEQHLTNALTGLINAICDMLHLGKAELTISYDDSIIEDSDKERANDRQDVRDGIMQPYEYRMKWYAEDEQTAKANVSTGGGLTLE